MHLIIEYDDSVKRVSYYMRTCASLCESVLYSMGQFGILYDRRRPFAVRDRGLVLSESKVGHEPGDGYELRIGTLRAGLGRRCAPTHNRYTAPMYSSWCLLSGMTHDTYT